MMGAQRRTAGWHPMLWAAIAVILLAPMVAMRFTREVSWTAFDFAVAATLLGGAALMFELVSRSAVLRRYRIVIGVALLAMVLLIWADGAVGII